MDVYNALVTAKCIDPNDDGGIQAVAAEHAMADQPAWMACLYAGGSVASCGVPCP